MNPLTLCGGWGREVNEEVNRFLGARGLQGKETSLPPSPSSSTSLCKASLFKGDGVESIVAEPSTLSDLLGHLLCISQAWSFQAKLRLSTLPWEGCFQGCDSTLSLRAQADCGALVRTAQMKYCS